MHKATHPVPSSGKGPYELLGVDGPYDPAKAGVSYKAPVQKDRMGKVKAIMNTDLPDPKDSKGSMLQLGTVTKPLSITCFNGSDYDTKKPDVNKRALYIKLEGDDLDACRNIEAHALDAAKTASAALFMGGNLSNEDVESLFRSKMKETEYGVDLPVNVRRGAGAGSVTLRRWDGQAVQKMEGDEWFPWSGDQNKPLRLSAVVSLTWNVQVEKTSRGKFDSVYVKFTPISILLFPDTTGGDRVTTPLGDVVSGVPMIQGPREWLLREPNYLGIGIPNEGATSTARNFTLGQHVGAPAESELLRTTLWAAYGGGAGPAVKASFSVAEGSNTHATLTSFQDNVLTSLIANRETVFGGVADCEVPSEEAIKEAFVPLMSDKGYGPQFSASLRRRNRSTDVQTLVFGDLIETPPASLHVADGKLDVKALPISFNFAVKAEFRGTAIEELQLQLYMNHMVMVSAEQAEEDDSDMFFGIPEVKAEAPLDPEAKVDAPQDPAGETDASEAAATSMSTDDAGKRCRDDDIGSEAKRPAVGVSA